MSTRWANAEIQAANCHGTLQLGEVSMNRAAWAVLNVATLWEPAPPRGENLFVPFRRGRLATQRERDERSGSLQMVVVGTVDLNGDPTDDPYVGLEENIAWLNENLFAYAQTMDPFDAVVTKPSGAQIGGPLQLGVVQFGWEVGIAVTLTIDFTLPDGQLDPVAP